MDLILLWPILAVVAGLVATGKNRSFFGWLILGFIFPGIAILAVAMTTPLERRPRSSELKRCPQCAEDVRRDARVCRFCGHRF